MKEKSGNQVLVIVAACHIQNHQITITQQNVLDQQALGFLGQQGKRINLFIHNIINYNKVFLYYFEFIFAFFIKGIQLPQEDHLILGHHTQRLGFQLDQR